MRKKILCAIMSAVMIVGALTGCGKKNDFKSTEKEKVTESVTESVAEAVTESTEEKDEYLTIDTDTICSRELHDFFQLYLGCWLERFHQPDCKKSNPQGINEMLEYTDIVGAFTPAEGMRVAEDFDTDNFPGLRECGTGESAFDIAFKHRYQLDKGTVSYNCSVSNLDANFSNFKYKAGTDAELRLFVNVKYNCSGVTNDSEEKMYAVSLVNNAGNPEEWLINAIYDAHKRTERGMKEHPGYSYFADFGYNSSQDPLFITDKLIDEDREVVDTTNMPDWKKEYINYIYGLDDKVTGYKFLDANSEGEPKLYIEYAEGTEAELLIYTKGRFIQSISATDNDNEFAYGDGKIVKSNMRAGTAEEYVYSYNESIDRFDLIFEGTYDDYDTDTPNNYCLVAQGTGQEERVAKEEYESKLKEARGNTEYTELMGDCLTGDVISAIQNY